LEACLEEEEEEEEEEDGVRYHVHLQYIKRMKNEDGGVKCRRWMKTVVCALKKE
jgi:hypothetical protein